LDLPDLVDEIILDFFTAPGATSVKYWTSEWGTEWEPQEQFCTQDLTFLSDTGRSSEKFHPFFVLSDDRSSYAIAIPWSGNWSLTIHVESGEFKLTLVSENQELKFITAHAKSADWQSAAAILLRDFRSFEPPGRSPAMEIEWNHWWPYQDKLINEEVFLQNARVAFECGIEVAVLDSGWFGSGAWEDTRGDWSQTNSLKFPSGLSFLAERTRKLGIAFGIWFELEAVGPKSLVNLEHQDFLALRDSLPLNLICLGNPEALEWAVSQLLEIIECTHATWIKFDFNLSPGMGCNRADHGHLAHEGHLMHVKNYYELLKRVRRLHPEITLENCSSGGLRWDYGVAHLVDYGFSSDRDWPEHALSVFWAYTHFFPVEKFLGWCDSEWLGNQPNQSFSIRSAMDRGYLEFIFAISLLGGFGLSQRLVDFSAGQRQLLKDYIDIYKNYFRPKYQDKAIVKHLTEQPLRNNLGPRTVAFALESSNKPTLIAIFQLPGATESFVHYPTDKVAINYRVKNLVTQEERTLKLNDGALVFDIHLNPNCSYLYEVAPI
jgi:alpha-galactosidase